MIAVPSTQGLDLRQYSREIETELRRVEYRSVQDCILSSILTRLHSKIHVHVTMTTAGVVYSSIPLGLDCACLQTLTRVATLPGSTVRSRTVMRSSQ